MAPQLNPTDADQLIALLRQSVAAPARPAAAVHFIDSALRNEFSRQTFRISAGSLQSLRTAQVALQANVVNLESLPPSPDTLRARLGLVAVRFMERLTWWQNNRWKQLAQSHQKVTELHTQAIVHLSERILELERRLERLSTGEPSGSDRN